MLFIILTTVSALLLFRLQPAAGEEPYETDYEKPSSTLPGLPGDPPDKNRELHRTGRGVTDPWIDTDLYSGMEEEEDIPLVPERDRSKIMGVSGEGQGGEK